jgi:muramoyltetrapeptide carboxypeptidase
MNQPPFLLPGNCIGIAATGRKVNQEEILPVIPILESWGYTVKLAPSFFSIKHSYLAGTDEERRMDLQSFLDDPTVHAILCARGGYGTTRIIDSLDFSGFKNSPKWIIGFSDITAFHLHLCTLGIESIHATMPILFFKENNILSLSSLQNLLAGNPYPIRGKENKFNKEGDGNGRVIGGNLSLLVDSLRTNSEIDTTGKILILEEIDEYFYKIDRMFTQLKRAGKLKSLAGLVIGYMTEIKESTLAFDESVEEIILFHTQAYGYPVGFGFPIGHEEPNLAWRHGSQMKLTVNKSGSVLAPVTGQGSGM